VSDLAHGPLVFNIFLQYEFFRISSTKKLLYVSNLHVSFVFLNILLGDMLMCLIHVMNDFLLTVYSHIQTNENPAKNEK
jgi:hypothetical protein